jgi:hypothetical protein
MVSAHHVKIKDDIWVIDSGASHHMTGNKTILQNYKKLDSKVMKMESNASSITGPPCHWGI